MGIGVLWLLEQVETAGSLRAAAATLGISYSKAYGMVKNLEDQLGLPVVERKRGGATHEGSTLTEFGHKFLELYDAFQAEAKQRLVEPFGSFTLDFEKLLRNYAEHENKE